MSTIKGISLFIVLLSMGFSVVLQNIFVSNDVQTKLQKKWQNNSFISVSELIGVKSGIVCAIGPYQDKILDNIEEDVASLNEFLKKNDYRGNEGKWALVAQGEVTPVIAEFNRKVDFFDGNISSIIIPQGFKPVECADMQNSYLYQFEMYTRKYILFGVKN